MKPGRELDAIVAEKVMGLVLLDTNRNVHEDGPVYSDNPEYSTDIAAATEVAGKMGWGRLTFHKIRDEEGGGWNLDAFPPDANADGETHAHAICLAALKAVGHEWE